MRKNKFVFLFVFFVFGIKSQTNYNWFPFHPNTQYNYKIDSAASSISAVVKMDSISATGLFHLNKIVSNCDTCKNSLLVNDFYDTTYVLNNQPQFGGHYFYKTSSSGFYHKGSKSFLLCPLKPVGYSWTFDTASAITATLLSKSLNQIFGVSDSVCLIKLSTNDSIVLSKTFGIVSFPFKYGAVNAYRLTGLEGSVNLGTRLKRFHDFFDFQVGDVFQYSFTYNDFNSLPPLLKQGRERWDVLSVIHYTDSIHYKVRKTYYDSLKIGNSSPAITAYTSTVTISFVDSLQHLANLYPGQEIRADPYFLYNNGMKYIHKIIPGTDNHSLSTKSFGINCPNLFLSSGETGAALETSFTNVYLNKNSQKVVGRQVTEGLGFTSELYNDYSRVYERCLIGYIKKSDTSGTVIETNPLSISKNAAEKNAFSFYPVPANETLAISGPIQKGMLIQILDCFGTTLSQELILATVNSCILKTSAYKSGLYFVRISGKDFDLVKKIIVSH